MQLLVEELGLSYSTLKQSFTVGDRDLLIRAFRPHLYKHLAPSGTLQVKVYDSTGSTLYATSESITITDISAINYFHGKVRFYCDVALLKNTTYQLWLVSGGGYAYAANAFVGWCLDWELAVTERDYTPTTSLETSFLFEPWEYHKVEKGRVF